MMKRTIRFNKRENYQHRWWHAREKIGT